MTGRPYRAHERDVALRAAVLPPRKRPARRRCPRCQRAVAFSHACPLASREQIPVWLLVSGDRGLLDLWRKYHR